MIVQVCDAHHNGNTWEPTPGQNWPEVPETIDQVRDQMCDTDAVFVWEDEDEPPVLVTA